MQTHVVKKGALPFQMIHALFEEGAIQGADKSQVKPASLDLTLSEEVYRLEHLFLPDYGEVVRSLLKGVGAERHDIRNPMERGVTYLVRLNEKLTLPSDVYAFCNPKSTTGRNDVHARVLADSIPRYDDISIPGWSGELWIAISPRSFPVKVAPGLSLSQARFFNHDTRIRKEKLFETLKKEPIIYNKNGTVYEHNATNTQSTSGSIVLTLDLSQDILGYQCSEPGKVLDLSKVREYDPEDFFIPIPKNGKSTSLREGKFYILSSRERVRVPPTLACEMRPMDERYGDFRAHYAGFIDPGWGWGTKGEGLGRTLTLEVRPFENLEVRHGQAIARICFEEMADIPELLYDDAPSNYLTQSGPTLSKQFKV